MAVFITGKTEEENGLSDGDFACDVLVLGGMEG